MSIHPLSGVMDRHGMLPEDWPCLRCGRKLNADGGHPAELYAGTWNGLCYPCTSSGPYVEKISVLDGCQVVNYPPHCPSWRRTRETFHGYRDCGTCQGSGVQGPGRSVGGGTYREYCRPCMDRFSAHPVRKAFEDASRELQERYQELFYAALLKVWGLKKTASRKIRQAALVTMDQTLLAAMKGQWLAAYHEARTEQQGEFAWSNQWRAPVGDEVLV